MGEGLGWGLPDLGGDLIGDVMRSPIGIVIANAQGPISLRCEPGIALQVVQLSVGQIVSPPIDFDDEPGTVMNEVGHVPTHRRLPADVQLQSSQCVPQIPFAEGHGLTQAPSPRYGGARLRCERVGWRLAGAPNPDPSPMKGEGGSVGFRLHAGDDDRSVRLDEPEQSLVSCFEGESHLSHGSWRNGQGGIRAVVAKQNMSGDKV